jgi:hypothetical protein
MLLQLVAEDGFVNRIVWDGSQYGFLDGVHSARGMIPSNARVQ